MEGRQTPPSRPPNPALPYREDCWSEGETSVLIDAWGDRYVELNRGNLRQKQWQEVADAVNSRPCDARRPPRTDVQCKNRIDTLKKKYKVEKSKIADGGGALASQWIFYNRLDALIGTTTVPSKKQAAASTSSPPMALPLPPSHRKGYPLPTASAVRPIETKDGKRHTAIVPVMEDSYYRRSYAFPPPAAAAVAAESEDESGSDSSRSSGLYRKRPRPMNKERSGKGLRKRKEGGGDEDGIRELSRAIVRMAEIYERVEVEKQRQMMELEKQRMEFAKSLEFQRMQMFVDSQVQLMKMKRGKRTDPGADESFRGYSCPQNCLDPFKLHTQSTGWSPLSYKSLVLSMPSGRPFPVILIFGERHFKLDGVVLSFTGLFSILNLQRWKMYNQNIGTAAVLTISDLETLIPDVGNEANGLQGLNSLVIFFAAYFE